MMGTTGEKYVEDKRKGTLELSFCHRPWVPVAERWLEPALPIKAVN